MKRRLKYEKILARKCKYDADTFFKFKFYFIACEKLCKDYNNNNFEFIRQGNERHLQNITAEIGLPILSPPRTFWSLSGSVLSQCKITLLCLQVIPPVAVF